MEIFFGYLGLDVYLLMVRSLKPEINILKETPPPRFTRIFTPQFDV